MALAHEASLLAVILLTAGCVTPAQGPGTDEPTVSSQTSASTVTIFETRSSTPVSTGSSPPTASFPAFQVDLREEGEYDSGFSVLRHVAGPCIDPREFTWSVTQGDDEELGGIFQMYERGDIDESDPIESWCIRETNPVLHGFDFGRRAVHLTVYAKATGSLVYQMELIPPDTSPPNVSFNKNSAARTLTVVQAERTIWGNYTVSPSACVIMHSDSTATASDPINAGDLIDCSNVSAQTFTAVITYKSTGAVVYSTTFS